MLLQERILVREKGVRWKLRRKFSEQRQCAVTLVFAFAGQRQQNLRERPQLSSVCYR